MKILFLESIHGRYEELKYASCVAHKFAEKLRKKGHDVIEIKEPTPKEANEAIRRYKPDIVWWVGHGSEDKATLEKLEVWITAINTEILDGTIAVAHACFTGLELGKMAVIKGANAYLGYTKELWFQWCNDPEYYNCACSGKNPYGVRPEVWMKILESSHIGSLTFIEKIADGEDYKTAFHESLKTFDKYEEELRRINPASQAERSIIRVQLWALENNKEAQVLYVSRKSSGKIETMSQTSLLKSALLFGSIIAPVIGLAFIGGESHAEKLYNI